MLMIMSSKTLLHTGTTFEGFKTDMAENLDETFTGHLDLIGTVRDGVATNEATLNEFETKMAEQETRMTDQETKMEEQETKTADLVDEKIAEQDRKTREMMDQFKAEMLGKFEAQEQKIAEQAGTIAGQAAKITEQAANIAEQAGKIAEQDRRTRDTIYQLKTEMHYKFEAQERKAGTIAGQEKKITEQAANIAEQAAKIAEQDEVIARQNEKVVKQEEAIIKLTEDIERIADHVSFEEVLLLTGGSLGNSRGLLSSTEVYPRTSGCSPPSLPSEMAGHQTFSTGGPNKMVALCGGFDGARSRASCLVLDPVNQRWEEGKMGDLTRTRYLGAA